MTYGIKIQINSFEELLTMLSFGSGNLVTFEFLNKPELKLRIVTHVKKKEWNRYIPQVKVFEDDPDVAVEIITSYDNNQRIRNYSCSFVLWRSDFGTFNNYDLGSVKTFFEENGLIGCYLEI